MNKPTHLLIPIKDIKPELKAMIEILIEDIKSIKQISLDEKDIEGKSKEVVLKAYDGLPIDENEEFSQRGFVKGYKQALKELLT